MAGSPDGTLVPLLLPLLKEAGACCWTSVLSISDCARACTSSWKSLETTHGLSFQGTWQDLLVTACQ